MTAALIATLKVRVPGKEEVAVPLSDGQTVRVGRETDNEFVVDDSAVSRTHASFTASKNGVVVADLMSRNGTFLNGERVQSLRDLKTGDIVDVGSTKIVVEVESDTVLNSLSASSRALTVELKPVSVTVMVASVVDYERLCRTVPHDEVDAMLNRWRDAVQTVCTALDGTVDKVVGRNVVALWMGRNAKEQALNAVQAALKVRTVTGQLSQKPEWSRHSATPWDCTVVLSSGAGLKGSAVRNMQRAFTVLGDPINLAFRLEEVISKLGQRVIIPAVTAQLISDEVPLRKIIGVKIRGDEAVEIFVPG